MINFVIDWNVYQQQTQNQYDGFVNSKNKMYVILDLYLPYFLQHERFTVDSINAIPVRSDVPALITSGTYDPITPPHLSEFLIPNFKNSFYYKFPKVGHAVIPTSCGENLLKQFLDNPAIPPNDSCLVALGDHEITFTTSYYKNDRIMSFVNGLTQQLNWWLLSAITFISIISLVNLIKTVREVIRKKTISNRWINLTSFLIILFVSGLGYFIYATAIHEGPLILFGLVKESNLLFYLVLIIIALAVVAMANQLIRKDKSTWSYVSLSSHFMFTIVVFWFQLFPNL